jgi:hypothetical protein
MGGHGEVKRAGRDRPDPRRGLHGPRSGLRPGGWNPAPSGSIPRRFPQDLHKGGATADASARPPPWMGYAGPGSRGAGEGGPGASRARLRHGDAGHLLPRHGWPQIGRLSARRGPCDEQALDDPSDGSAPGPSTRGRFCVSEGGFEPPPGVTRTRPSTYRGTSRRVPSCGG